MRGLADAWESHADDWTVWARRPGHDSYWTFHRDVFLGLVPAPGRVLRPGGRLCVAVVHPLNAAGRFQSEAPDADYLVAGDYFQCRRTEWRQEKGDLFMTFEAMHRPLQDYFAAMTAASLLTESVREVAMPASAHWSRIPLFLDLRAVRR